MVVTKNARHRGKRHNIGAPRFGALPSGLAPIRNSVRLTHHRSACDSPLALKPTPHAGRLCGADYATITRQKDGELFFAEAYGY
jgi:hypothetical protein